MKMEPIKGVVKAHLKGWGKEVWIANNELYCGKILEFNKGAEFSMHYHIKKEETWAVTKGKLLLKYYDLTNAEEKRMTLEVGDTVHLKPCIPHKLIAIEESSVFEVSTQHFEEDSYRVRKGDSQK
jgi:quercetin dioxygenase-like cupin family protein|tara:strand:- start:3660 stop:4034 length:375 start_codon:yes stop_codon:yes gene_type:complete